MGDLPLDRFYNLVYWYVTRDADSDDVEKFRRSLYRPPAGVVAEGENNPWSREHLLANARAAAGAKLKQ